MPKRNERIIRLVDVTDEELALTGQDFTFWFDTSRGKYRYYVRLPAEYVVDRLRKRGLVYLRPTAV